MSPLKSIIVAAPTSIVLKWFLSTLRIFPLAANKGHAAVKIEPWACTYGLPGKKHLH